MEFRVDTTEEEEKYYCGHFDMFRKFRANKVYKQFGNASAIKSSSALPNMDKMKNVIAMYEETKDIDYMIHLANLAMLEYMKPSPADYMFRPFKSVLDLNKIYLGK